MVCDLWYIWHVINLLRKLTELLNKTQKTQRKEREWWALLNTNYEMMFLFLKMYAMLLFLRIQLDVSPAICMFVYRANVFLIFPFFFLIIFIILSRLLYMIFGSIDGDSEYKTLKFYKYIIYSVSLIYILSHNINISLCSWNVCLFITDNIHIYYFFSFLSIKSCNSPYIVYTTYTIKSTCVRNVLTWKQPECLMTMTVMGDCMTDKKKKITFT